MSNLSLRLLTALIGVPLILAVTYVGGAVFAGFMLVAVLLTQSDAMTLFSQVGSLPYKGLGLFLAALVVLSALWAPALVIAAVVGVGALLYAGLQSPEANVFPRLGATVWSVVYPAAMLATLLLVRLDAGPQFSLDATLLTLLPVVMIWATDTLAYVFGKSFGKHPLAPKVSPKKTWEGAAGGVLGAVLIAGAFYLWQPDLLAPWHLAVVIGLAGGVSQLGDLAESHLKRAAGVKDSGTLLPGHGGMLDRVDALIVTAPLYWLFVSYVVLG